MSEEKECKCFCKSESFRKFLISALGTFVGAYMALSLFSAIHMPKTHYPYQFRHPSYSHGQFMHHKHFKHGDKIRKDFNKGEMKGNKEIKVPDADD